MASRHNREDVLVAAEAIVDRDGWASLTMTSLAAELGVKVPSLYNHVESLDALRGELQNRTMHDLGRALRDAAMGKAGADGLRALAATLRSFALAHPARYDLATRRPVDRIGFVAATLEAGAALRAVMASLGLPDDIEQQLTFFAALHGVLDLENAGFFLGAADGAAMYERTLNGLLGALDDLAATR